jgi:hypothetical protein
MAKDHGLSIANLGAGSRPCIASKAARLSFGTTVIPSGGPAAPTRGPAWRVCPCTDIAQPWHEQRLVHALGPLIARAGDRRLRASALSLPTPTQWSAPE